jgi:hypothetical protein
VTSTVTTTVWVIDSIHNDTTNTWTDTLATVTTCRTDLYVLVLDVTNNTDSSCCFQPEATHFTRWQTHLSVITFLCHKLSLGAS